LPLVERPSAAMTLRRVTPGGRLSCIASKDNPTVGFFEGFCRVLRLSLLSRISVAPASVPVLFKRLRMTQPAPATGFHGGPFLPMGYGLWHEEKKPARKPALRTEREPTTRSPPSGSVFASCRSPAVRERTPGKRRSVTRPCAASPCRGRSRRPFGSSN